MTSASVRLPDPECAGLLPRLEQVEEQTAIRCGRTGIIASHADFREAVLAVAMELPHDHKRLAFLLARNDYPTLVGLFALLSAGHAVALLDPGLPAEKFAELATVYSPDLVVSAEPIANAAEAVSRELRAGGSSIFVAVRPAPAEAIHEDLALLLSTSGTTGSQKFVRLSGNAVATNARQIARALDISPASVAIAHLPLHYSYGLSVVTSHLAVGGPILLTQEGLMSPGFWSFVEQGGGTHFPGVPFHYTTLLRLGLSQVPSTVSTFTQAGGKLDTAIQHKIHEAVLPRGGRFFVMYGQTEASPRMTTLPAASFLEKAGSVGVALEGGRIVIKDDMGNPATGTGRVVYEGPNVMMGYATSRADLALGDTMSGRLDTGDLGRLDDDGYLYLTGRRQRFAKIAGLRLGLDEIEAELAQICITACQDEGDRIGVYYENEEEGALKARIRSLAASYKIPSNSFSLRKMNRLPRKPSGKLDYGLLREASHV